MFRFRNHLEIVKKCAVNLDISEIHVLIYDFDVYQLKRSSYYSNLEYFREKIILSVWENFSKLF